MTVCEVFSGSPEGTKRLAVALGRILTAGDFLCLSGELGAGKTTFAQGLAEGLGVTEEYVTSPSFALVNEYAGRLPFYHVDLYRLSGPEDLADIGFDELPGEGVAAVEWPERAGGMLPEERLDIHIEYAGSDTRRIAFRTSGGRYEKILEEICRTPRW